MTEHEWDGSETMGDTQLDESKLGELAEFANQMQHLDTVIDDLDERIKQAKKKYRDLNETVIPGLMEELSLSQIKLKDGTSLTIEDFYSAKIPNDREEEAHEWLENEGADDIIKGEVRSSFGRGDKEREAEQRLVDMLTEMSVSFTHKRSIHWQTLKAFVKERITSGQGIPLDLFGVYQGKKTKIRR